MRYGWLHRLSVGQRLTGSGNFRNGWLEEGAGLKEQFGPVCRLPKPSCADKSELWEGKQIDIMASLASPMART